LNCYLLPAMLVNSDNRSCTRQDERADWIGAAARNHHIILLQEMWGSQVWNVQKHIANTHYIPYSYKTFGYSTLDTVWYWMKATGGLWQAASLKFPVLREEAIKFQNTATKSQKGVFAGLLDVSSSWGNGKRLLFVNTHLDCGHTKEFQESQEKQLVELHDFIVKVLISWECANSNCGILLVGDFNISGGDNKMYPLMKQLLAGKDGEIRDLWVDFQHETKKNQDVWEGGATYESTNSLASWTSGSDRIDHLFTFDAIQIHSNKKGKGTTTRLMRLAAQEIQVLRQESGKEFSDHWAQILSLKYLEE